MQQKETSRLWKRFKKKRAALVSIVIIVLLVIMALFAYPLATDDTTDANRIMVELAALKPGTKVQFYKIENSQSEDESSFIEYLIHGRKANDEWIPIRGYKISKDSIVLQKVIDESTTEQVSLPIDKSFNISSNVFTKKFLLGTDKFGRDVYSRLLLGARVSLSVGFIAVVISIFIGVLLGALSAYFGSWVDSLITWLINVIWAIPTLLLVFAITFALGKGFWQIFIAVGFTMWVGTARLIRGQVMAIKELEYIQAAKTMGFSSFRIIVKHILPNVMGATLVMAASNFATAILIEAGLSFLGIGVQPPTPSWGLMIKENYNFIITNRPMLAIVPGIAIMIVVLAFNILGNGLRDVLDVKDSK